LVSGIKIGGGLVWISAGLILDDEWIDSPAPVATTRRRIHKYSIHFNDDAAASLFMMGWAAAPMAPAGSCASNPN
jgi:hypothetical protein